MNKLNAYISIPLYIRILLLILLIVLIIYLLFQNQINKYLKHTKGKLNNESFINPSIDMDKYFGNIIYNKDVILNTRIKNVDLLLPMESKITGFIIKNKDLEQKKNLKYSLMIGNNLTDMKQVKNEFGYYKFNFGDNIKDLSLFETDDGLPIYTGNKIKLYLENVEDLDNNDLDETYELECIILGLDIYAPNYNEYKKYTYTKASDNDNTLELKNIMNDSTENSRINFLNGNKKVIAIKINKTIDDNLKIKFSNSYDGNNRIYVVKGPIQDGFDVSNTVIIYFNKPVIAEKLHFNKNIGSDPVLYLQEVSNRDEINFKLQMSVGEQGKGLVMEGEKCPNISDMLNKQLQAQQICEALEYKDRIKNAEIVYEKEKSYLEKLARQEKELKNLEILLNNLIKRKNDRVSKNKYYNIQQLDKELRKIESARKKAESDLIKTRDAHDIKLELNLDPQYTDLLKKFENTEIFNI